MNFSRRKQTLFVVIGALRVINVIYIRLLFHEMHVCLGGSNNLF